MTRQLGTRLYVHHPLAAGGAVEATAAQAHYLRNVLRLGRGDTVAVFNGRDGEWRARIESLSRSAGTLVAEEQVRSQHSEPDIWLLFAPIKRAPLDFLVQKAVELGVSSLQPVFTRHTDAARVNLQRLRANVVEAAEQCGRLSLPQVAEPRHLPAVLDDWPDGRRLIVCAEAGQAAPLHDVLKGAERGQTSGTWAILVGPEGGFHSQELDALRELPFSTLVGLGSRVLRAETAGLAALACWQAVLGDWRSDLR